VTSLPDGRLGASAYRFVDWLQAAGQSWWQMLPLGPPDRYRSPYKSSSAFAAWRGLLGAPRAIVTAAELSEFRDCNAYWLDDWERFAGPGATADQVRFEREWSALRMYALERGVRLLGDLPIYVAPGSADHRARPELFRRGEVAGAPPDAYAPRGQLWGNPTYDWPALQRRGYRWWADRVRRALELFDCVRIDHFRGFVSYWAVPSGSRSAVAGRWRRGPGRAVFAAIERELALGALPFLAEDLGVITPAVERLRDGLGLPGMLVLQFGFDPGDPSSPHRFANHAEDRFVYSSTHDSDTARGWYESLDRVRRAVVDRELARFGERQPWWGLVSLALASPARVAIVPAQDLLGLGSEARMNDPSRAGGSWRWRLRAGALNLRLAARLREATERADRIAGTATAIAR